MTALTPLVSPGSVACCALHGARLLPVAVLCPFLGGPLVPWIVRAALAFGLGGCAWAAHGAPSFDAGGVGLGLALLRELTIGTAIAVVAALPFEAARAAGRLVDTLRGSTLVELHVAPIRQRESATGDLLVQWTLVLAASVGGDRLVVAGLLATFRAVPVGTFRPAAQPTIAIALHASGELLASALAVGAPAAAGILAGDLVLALASRAAPHLQVAPSAQPARAALGLLAIVVPAAAAAGRLTSTVALSSSLISAVGGAP